MPGRSSVQPPARPAARLVFPSPVVMLSIVAVAMAAVAFVATRGSGPTEREVATSPPGRRPHSATPTPGAREADEAKPPVERGKVYVEVYNNSGITGLAGTRRPAGHRRSAGRSSAPTTGTARSPPTRSTTPTRLKRGGQAARARPRHRAHRPRRRPDAPRPADRDPHRRALTATRPWLGGVVEFTSAEGERRYAALVRAAAESVVGLDFDGTLSPIVEDPAGRTSTPTPAACWSTSPPRCAPSR